MDKIIMQENGKVSYDGYNITWYLKNTDISNEKKWVIDHFINTGKAIVIKSEKSIKEYENKQIKTYENKKPRKYRKKEIQ